MPRIIGYGTTKTPEEKRKELAASKVAAAEQRQQTGGYQTADRSRAIAQGIIQANLGPGGEFLPAQGLAGAGGLNVAARAAGGLGSAVQRAIQIFRPGQAAPASAAQAAARQLFSQPVGGLGARFAAQNAPSAVGRAAQGPVAAGRSQAGLGLRARLGEQVGQTATRPAPGGTPLLRREAEEIARRQLGRGPSAVERLTAPQPFIGPVATGASVGVPLGVALSEPVAEGLTPQTSAVEGDSSAVDRFLAEQLAAKGITLDPNKSVLEQRAEFGTGFEGSPLDQPSLIDQTQVQPNLTQPSRSTSPFVQQPTPVTETPSLLQEPEVPGAPPTTPDLGASPAQGAPATGTPNLGGGGGSLDQITTDILSELNELSAGLASSKSPDVAPIFLQQAQSIIDLLNQQESQLRSEAESEGRQIDPSTKFTLDTMRERLEESLKATREELNRRGLFHSGILVEAEQILRKGNLSDEGRLLADRLTGIQQRLQEGLGQLRSQRFSTASQFGLRGAEAQFEAGESEADRQRRLSEFLVGSRLDLRDQRSREAAQSAEREQRAREAAASRAFEAQEAERQRTFQGEQGRLGRESDAQQLDREIEAGRFERSSGGSASATQNIIAHLLSTAPTYEAALSQLQAEMAELVAVGVDMKAVLREISQLPRAGTRQTGGPQF